MKVNKLIAITLLLSACNGHKPSAKEGTQRILAVYIKKDSTKDIAVLLRNISKQIRFDSATSRDKISTDTIWGYPVIVQMRDSLGKLVLDSMKKPKMNPNPIYFVIRKDSVNWRIEGISVDSLLKK